MVSWQNRGLCWQCAGRMCQAKTDSGSQIRLSGIRPGHSRASPSCTQAPSPLSSSLRLRAKSFKLTMLTASAAAATTSASASPGGFAPLAAPPGCDSASAAHTTILCVYARVPSRTPRATWHCGQSVLGSSAAPAAASWAKQAQRVDASTSYRCTPGAPASGADLGARQEEVHGRMDESKAHRARPRRPPARAPGWQSRSARAWTQRSPAAPAPGSSCTATARPAARPPSAAPRPPRAPPPPPGRRALDLRRCTAYHHAEWAR